MPTVLKMDGYRFYFYGHEPNEPPHASAKFWLHDGTLAKNTGFAAQQLTELTRLVRLHRAELLEAWNGFFG